MKARDSITIREVASPAEGTIMPVRQERRRRTPK